MLRAWERRYGVPLPKRSASGHRLYSEEDIRAVRWIRKKTDWGIGVRRAVELFKGRGSVPGARASLEAVRYTLLDHLLAGEEGKAGAVLETTISGHGIEAVCVEVVEPVLVLVGELWHRGVIGVAHEHWITESLKSVLIRLLAEEKKAGPDGVRVIVGCAPEELHEMGLLMLALFLARRGLDVLYLGQAVPLEDLSASSPGGSVPKPSSSPQAKSRGRSGCWGSCPSSRQQAARGHSSGVWRSKTNRCGRRQGSASWARVFKRPLMPPSNCS